MQIYILQLKATDKDDSVGKILLNRTNYSWNITTIRVVTILVIISNDCVKYSAIYFWSCSCW